MLTLVAAALFLTLATRCHFLSLTPPRYMLFLSEATPTRPQRGEQRDARAHPPPDHAPSKQEQEVKRSCGCGSCVSDMATSDWFRQRFDPEQQPILRQNHSLDHSALFWWMSLQRAGTARSLQEVTSDLFSVIAPPPPPHKSRPSLCHTCAVVGNSGNLRQSGHGPRIDSHHSVIRMNRAVIAGFERDVGNRSTHHFLYPESAIDLQPREHLVLLPFKLRDLEWLRSALTTGNVTRTYMPVKRRVAADRDRVLVLSPEFFSYIHHNWTQKHGRYPSTGITAVIYALHTCDQVSLFGFGADSKGNWHHYWEENRFAGAFRKTGVHNADFETEIIQQLHKEKKVQLYL